MVFPEENPIFQLESESESHIRNLILLVRFVTDFKLITWRKIFQSPLQSVNLSHKKEDKFSEYMFLWHDIYTTSNGLNSLPSIAERKCHRAATNGNNYM